MSRTAMARLALYPFLVGLIACGLFSVEAWPFTAWKLFSQVRGPEQAGWSAVAFTGNREEPIDFASLGRGYTGALHVMIGLPKQPEAEREAVCRTWATAVRDHARPIDGVRIYRTRSLVPRTDERPPAPRRTLFLECVIH